MAFPPPGAEIYRNSEGEVLGWDGPAIDDGDPGDPYADSDRDDGYDEDDSEGDGGEPDWRDKPPFDVEEEQED